MEQIRLIGDDIYYGEHKCLSADSAYRLFREDYYKAVRNRYERLGRRRERTERIHGFGFEFDADERGRLDGVVRNYAGKRVTYRLLGLVGTAYCRILGIHDIPAIPEEMWEDYIDWLLADGNRMLRLKGRKGSGGRTDNRRKTRYNKRKY